MAFDAVYDRGNDGLHPRVLHLRRGRDIALQTLSRDRSIFHLCRYMAMVGLYRAWDVPRIAHDIERRRHQRCFKRFVVRATIVPFDRFYSWADKRDYLGCFYAMGHERFRLLNLFFERIISHCIISFNSFLFIFSITS